MRPPRGHMVRDALLTQCSSPPRSARNRMQVTSNKSRTHLARRQRRVAARRAGGARPTARWSSCCTASRNSGSNGATISARSPRPVIASSLLISAATISRASRKASPRIGSICSPTNFCARRRTRPQDLSRRRPRLGLGGGVVDGDATSGAARAPGDDGCAASGGLARARCERMPSSAARAGTCKRCAFPGFPNS